MSRPRRRAEHDRPGRVMACARTILVPARTILVPARTILVIALLGLVGCTGPSPADAPTGVDPDAAAVAAPMATPPPPSPAVGSAPATPAGASPTQSPTPPPPPPPAPAPVPSAAEAAVPEILGTFDVALAPEVSGIVASRRHDDLLWLVDDGPGTTSVVAIRTSGELVTRVEMAGVDGRDTEDIAAGPCAADDPTPCLFVGDIGDNRAVRDRILVHRFPEPDTDATSTAVTTASYTHPAGPVDAEALLVGGDGLPVILTKEPDHSRVLAATAFTDGQLVEVATIEILPPPSPMLTMFTGLTVTAADSSADGQRVLLRTYDHVVELTAPEPGSALATLATWTATTMPAALEGQGEAIAYLDATGSYVTASEGSGAMSVLWRR